MVEKQGMMANSRYDILKVLQMYKRGLSEDRQPHVTLSANDFEYILDLAIAHLEAEFWAHYA